MEVKSESEVPQLCLTLSDPINCSPSDSSVHGIFQARVLEWGAIAFSGRQYNIVERMLEQGPEDLPFTSCCDTNYWTLRSQESENLGFNFLTEQ